MRPDLLEVLREPGTYSEFRLEPTKTDNGEVLEGELVSIETGKRYPIRDGIVRFVNDDAYADSFGLQWNEFSKVQIDSHNGANYSRDRFESETTWTEAELRNEWVLDAGCGAGRFSEIAASKGARLISLDFSRAVDAARANLIDRYPNVQYIQGDILNLPFAPGSLAFVFSIGVLQHTPDPEQCVIELVNRVKPGGKFCFTIYGRRWYSKLFSKYLIRPVTKRMPKRALLRTIQGTMPILFPLTDFLFRLPMGLGKVFAFAIPVANYVGKTNFTRDQRYQEAILDTFDMLSPTYDQPMSPEELKSTLARCGLSTTDYRFPTTSICNVTGQVR